MSKNFHLKINNPCSENFSEFKTTNAGGFCNLCLKEVVDFTKMNETEILLYFENNTINTCGRIHQSQLKIYSEALHSKTSQNFNWLNASLFSFSLLSLISTQNSYAQNLKSTITIQNPQNENNKKQNDTTQYTTNKYIIEGIVVSAEDDKAMRISKGDPIIGVTVLLKNSTLGTTTDINGKFRLVIPNAKPGDELIFSFLMFKTKEFTISKNNSTNINIIMELDIFDDILIGEISTNEVFKSNRSFIHRLKELFR